VNQPTPHRSARRLRRALTAAIAAAVAACGGSPQAQGPEIDATQREFSGTFAWAALEDLARGPRAVGTEGAEDARSMIKTRLGATGVAVETVTTTFEAKGLGPLVLTHLVARLPGASPDRIVLVAPYDSGKYDDFAFVGANDGASGAALLVEMARVLAGRALPYTVELVWLEGEGRIGHGEAEERELRWLGSRTLAERWAETGHLDGIRLLVSFNRVCDAELRVARDTGSNRELREAFWRAAQHLGITDSFAPDRGYESVESSHAAFRDHGVRAVVAIEDTAFGGGNPPGRYAGKEDVLAHCDPDSLQAVGRVSLEAVDSIATRLAKIDRFARMPTAESGEPAAVPDRSSPEAPDAAGAR
jgi:hypothetical protein